MSLVDQVRNAGVIGCGGAGFPTHVKIDSRVDLVIANGAECEPLLNSDQRVMENYAGELIEGLRLVMKNVGATKAYVGVKKNYHDSIAAFERLLEPDDSIELGLLDNFYPAGDEQILVTELTGRVVPEGGIPLNVGVVVSNVLSLVQIARAARGRMVVEREVTLVGDIRNPQVIVAPIGTPIRKLIEIAQPTIELDDLVIIDGGPMMGRVVSPDGAVNKTTSGLLFLHKDHPIPRSKTIPIEYALRRGVAACCQCRLCTDVCSRYMQGHSIEPHLMMRTLAYRLDSPSRAMTASFLCSQCGLCEFACPMDLSPKRAFAEILKGLRQAKVQNPHHEAPEQPHEFNRYRKIGKDRLIKRYQLSPYDSHDLPLTRMEAPDRVVLSLRQSIGAPSQPIVNKGEYVRQGELVAAIPEGALGSNLHASIHGDVVEVNSENIVIEGRR